MQTSSGFKPYVVAFLLISALGIAAAGTPVPARANELQLVPVLQGLSSPDYIASAHDGSQRLFVVEQPGRIQVLAHGATAPSLFVDISSKVLFGGEQGLLGLAFHPQFAANSRFFVNYTRQPDGATVIAEYRASADPAMTAASEIPLLVIGQPYTNHNGGMIEFGADGYLYVGMGDGGSANDPENRAQNVNELLGKILRIDVDHPAGNQAYSSPADNPFAGAIPGRDEIYALGLRNPFRFSFDRPTGQLYVGDVGQDQLEEVDIVTLGKNYGWRVYEGTQCTNLDPALCTPTNFVPPIAQYDHSVGRCSIIGGYVYRGSAATLPGGTYVFGDFCTGEIFSLAGGVFSTLLDTPLNISSFGEDEAGEIYVVGLGGTVHRLSAISSKATTTTLASSGSPSFVGSSVTFTATVNGSAPSGTVAFTADGSTLSGCAAVSLPAGSVPSKSVSCATASLGVGVHSIVATYAGDVANDASASTALSQVISAVSPPGTVVNPSFEIPALGAAYQYNPAAAGIGWSFAGGSGIQGNNSAWGAASAPGGTQTAFIQGTGSIAQTVTLTAGSYTLSFQVARRLYSSVAPNLNPVRVTIDGSQIGGLASPGDTSFSLVSIPFSVASTGPHTIAFTGTDPSDKTTFIDEVALSANPVTGLVNAGFEVPALGGSYQYGPSGAGVGWTFGNGGGIQGNNSAWGAASAPGGTQTAFIQGTGSMAQTVTLTAGSYTLSFQVARRLYSSVAPNLNPVRVTIDGSQIGGLASPGDTSFSLVSIPFSVASTGPHTIAFTGTDPSDKTTFIDEVALSANPVTGLVNAGFEVPALGGSYQYSPSGTGVGWTFGSGSGIQGNNSAWGAAQAPGGTQTAFIQGTGSIAQTVTLTAGSYTLSFQVARRLYSSVAPNLNPVRVTIDGSQIGGLASPGDTSFSLVSIPFSVASTGPHTIAFTGTDPSDKTTFIDEVALSAVAGTAATLAAADGPAQAVRQRWP